MSNEAKNDRPRTREEMIAAAAADPTLHYVGVRMFDLRHADLGNGQRVLACNCNLSPYCSCECHANQSVDFVPA